MYVQHPSLAKESTAKMPEWSVSEATADAPVSRRGRMPAVIVLNLRLINPAFVEQALLSRIGLPFWIDPKKASFEVSNELNER